MTRRITTRLLPMLGRAVRLRCPRCGSRGWFKGWFTRAERCPGCGIRIERQDGFVLGAVTVNIITTFGLLAVVIVAGFVLSYPDVAVAPILAAGVGVAVVWPVVFFPFSHTLWAAVDFAMRPIEPGEAEDAARALQRR